MADFDSSTVEMQPAAKVGKPFKNWTFEITVSDVEITSSMEYKNYEGAHAVERPELGRFVVVPVRVTNVGKKPESFCVTCSSLVDSKGRTFTTDTIYPNLDQGFEDDLQPDEAGTGYMLFDVPKTVTGIRTVVVQPDPSMAGEVIPTEVRVS